MIGESRNKASLYNLVTPLEHIGKCGETIWQETNRPQYGTRTYLSTYIHTHFHIIQHPQQHYTPKNLWWWTKAIRQLRLLLPHALSRRWL